MTQRARTADLPELTAGHSGLAGHGAPVHRNGAAVDPTAEGPQTVGACERAGAPGWPRRRSRCAVDTLPDGTLRAGARQGRPTVWVADRTADGWDPWIFHEERAARMRTEDLCQLCGRPRAQWVYALAPTDRAQTDTSIAMYGGALCSLGCARLTAAMCPHYTASTVTEVYSVPRGDRVDLIGVGFANDDECDLAGLLPVAKVTVVAKNVEAI